MEVLVSSDHEKLLFDQVVSITARVGLPLFCNGRARTGVDTDLQGRDGNGLARVNIHTGETEREIRLRELDERFVTDEALGLMFVSSGNRLLAYSVAGVR